MRIGSLNASGLVLAGMITVGLSLAAPFFYVNIPCRDDWGLVVPVQRVLEHTVHTADFWAPHEEHRLFLTRLLLTYWAAWTSWDMRGVPWLDMALILTATLSLTAAADKPGKIFWKNPAFWVACTFAFSLPAVKTINWLMNLNTYLSAAAAVGSIACAGSSVLSLKRWSAAIVLALIATFSFGTGLALWFAMIPLILMTRNTGSFKKIALMWSLSGVISFFIYFYGMGQLEHVTFISTADRARIAGHFFITYLGALFHPLSAEFFGIMGLIASGSLFFYLTSPEGRKDTGAVTLGCVVLFVLGNAFVITLTRAHFGAAYAVTERYIALSSYLWVALSLWLFRKGPRAILAVWVAALLLISPLHWFNFEDNRLFMLEAAKTIQKKDPGKDALLELFEVERVVENAIPILKSHKLSIFRS